MGEALARLTIHGRPVILKNNKQIVVVHGRRIIKSNPRVEAYQHQAIAQLVDQWGNQPPIRCPIQLTVTVYLAARRDSGNLPDLSNLYQMPEDLLQAAGIIEDDRQIESHDGSRRICMCDGDCDRKPFYRGGAKGGQRKPTCGAIKSCPYERLLIEIREV